MTAQSPQTTESSARGTATVSVAGTGETPMLPESQVFPSEVSFKRLAEKLRELGISVSFWDRNGSILTAPSFQGQFCCLMCGQKGTCLEAMSQLAQKTAGQPSGHGTSAVSGGRKEITTSPSGCCVFTVPLQARRRLIGSVMGCFPTLQTIESEEFLRTCSRTHLDTEAMASLCRQEAVYTERQAENMCSILEWIVQCEQAKKVDGEELATLSSNLANTYEELSLLYSISSSMKVTRRTTEFFENLCNELLEVMHVQSAAVVLHSRENSDSDDHVVAAGELPLTAEQLIGLSRRYIAPQAAKQPRRAGDSTDREEGRKTCSMIVDNRFFEHACPLGAEHLGAEIEQIYPQGIRTLAAAPLMIAGEYQGAVFALNKIDGEFYSTDLKLISSVSGQATMFLENHNLYEDVQDLLMGVLHALTASIDAKDPYTCGHSHRVALISRKLAALSGFDEHRVERIYLAGLLHDIGKIGVPEAVLQKPGRLTDSEFESVKRHPEIGATILGGIRQMEDIIPIVLNHHKRLDGGGYPAGLSAGEIPIEALIVGLADSFDAMTSSRTYRSTMPLDVAITEIRRCSGTQFDPRLVELLLSLNLEDFLAELRSTEMSDSKTFGNSPVLPLLSAAEPSQNANVRGKQ